MKTPLLSLTAFLLTKATVVEDGTVCFPGEIYLEFGIRPVVDAPAVIE
jgi:hypothetical protein